MWDLDGFLEREGPDHAAPRAAGEDPDGSTFVANDGAVLSYREAGSGRPVVLLPGWTLSADVFEHQLEDLGADHRVIALDHRGHGRSDPSASGYHISRLSEDVHELLVQRGLEDAVLVGHSMGASVAWSYWQQHRSDRLAGLVLVDEAPTMLYRSEWTREQRSTFGATMNVDDLYARLDALSGDDGLATSSSVIHSMFTPAFSQAHPDLVDDVLRDSLVLPRVDASRLLCHHVMTDWRALIPTIDIPTLVVGGKASIVPWQSQLWIAGQIPDARLVLFEESEGGSHLMFMENPTRFNHEVRRFIDTLPCVDPPL